MCSNTRCRRPPSPPSLPVPDTHHSRPTRVVWGATVGLCLGVTALAETNKLQLTWVECLAPRDASGSFQLEHAASTNALQTAPPHQRLFRAVRPDGWFQGLVPLYAVDVGSRVELRRLPGRGQENLSDPFVFILPHREESPAALRIAGRWEVAALRSDKSPANFAWELATDGNGRVAGRFEQLTDYRFAHVLPGNFTDGKLTVEVEYLNQRFSVAGTESNGTLQGNWRESEGADSGAWRATRSGVPLPSGIERGTLPLWEWIRPSDGAHVYGIGAAPGGEGWIRTPRPLGDVWPLVNPGKAPHLTPEQSHDPRP